jgi:formylglycine-generating enzyme required for sulfatase activity
MHQPIHEVEVGAFLIARTEVTNGDYLEYLRDLPAGEARKEPLPGGFTSTPGGRFLLQVGDATLGDTDPYCSAGQPCVDWSRLPVGNVSRQDAERYAAWLARSGRLPRARLCTDREWERAARGADDRRFPTGNHELTPDYACTLASYGGVPSRAGPCPVGTHPASRTLFGVDDMVGSQWEWTSGVADAAEPQVAVNRGGGYRDEGLAVVLSNRELMGAARRHPPIGMRVCADLP